MDLALRYYVRYRPCSKDRDLKENNMGFSGDRYATY